MPFFHDASHPDPPEVRNWRVHLLSISVSMGAAAMGYDTGVIGGTLALPSFRRDFGLDRASQHERDTLSGNIVSTFQAGTFFGSLLTFPLVEKYGRVRGMFAAGVVFMIGAVLMTASNGHLGLIYAGRGIAGLGIGSASLIIPVYIAEISPPSIRGRLVGIFEILSQGGSMLGFWINYIVDRTVSSNTKTQWIIPLALQMLPGLFLLLGAALAPESPRWLAKNNNWEKARRNLHDLRQLPPNSKYIEEELQGIRTQIENERLLAGEAGRSRWSGFKELFHKGTRNRVAIGLTLMMCQNMTGVNIITYYSPRIFETLGLTGTSTKLFATGFYGVAKTLGMIIFSVWLVERIGRRKGLILGGFIGSLPMWYIGGYVFVADPATKAAAGQFTRNGWGYLAMDQGITWVYCSEIFPIRIRMLCVALTTADQWLWSFIVSRTTPYMITSLGYGTYFFFASLMIIFGAWAYFFVPETKGKTLEDMDRIFGAPDAHKNDQESSVEETRRVDAYDEDMKPEIEQHEFSEKQEEVLHHERR
ncbi:putative quinate permease [Rhizoctonia solani]|uniref:Putative quinate permease n=1 Tax=Rhizoctonia solani TaxID=456999 RepID=A0A0K6G2M0_9AGAM|nr:putative quinate permease [Rhizoctonia solani]